MVKSPIKEVGPSREAWDEAAASDNTPELFILWQGAKQQLRERALAYMAEADLAKRVAELAKAWTRFNPPEVIAFIERQMLQEDMASHAAA